jgi:AcrR family transcriptional regulator
VARKKTIVLTESSSGPEAVATAPVRPGRRRDKEVLDVAAQLFFERGYADASVQDVAEALGMLKGSLYYYIDTKEDLLFRLLEEVNDDFDVVLEEWTGKTELAPLERLAGYVRAAVEYNTANLARMSVYYHEMDRLSPERRAQTVARRRPHMAFVVSVIEEAQSTGAADPGADARLMANFVFGALIWIYRWYRPRGRVRREKIAEACADFVLHGVVGPGRR